MDSFDDMSSDSEDILDEVIVTSTCSSPVHVCDQSPTSHQAQTHPMGGGNRNFPPLANITNTLSTQIATTSFNNHQLTADICNYKNSKSRRLEYSLKCLKYGRSNPSQDSAFGSLTDTDLSIGSSSFRLSSFQSISSPIDEGVEDITLNADEIHLATGIDSAVSSPCREGSVSPRIKYNTSSSSTSNLQFDPPKILVNDQNSIYTTSPSKRNGTVEVFSQKYRVCSFEDMSPNKTSKQTLKNANRVAFRSLEEERRIDHAFTPIKDRTHSENIQTSHKDNEKYKKLTHQSFRVSNSLEPPEPTTSAGMSNTRNTMWKDSRFYRKSKIAKSNDSLLTTESPRNGKFSLLTTKAHSSDNHYESEQNEYRVTRNKSAIEIATTAINNTNYGSNGSGIGSGLGHGGRYHFYNNHTTNSEDLYCYRSERQLFNLFKLKQTAITTSDYNFDDENYPPNNPNDNNRYTPSPVLPTPIPTPSPSTSPLKKIKSSGRTSSSSTLSAGCMIKTKNSNFRSLDFELNSERKDRSINNEDDDSSTENTPSMSHKELCKIMKQSDGNNSAGSAGDSGNGDGGGGVSGSSVEEKTPLLDSIEMSPISSPNEDESDENVM